MSPVDGKMQHDFTFAICAYKDSPYLEEAVLSAKKQSVPVDIFIATSTPSDYIRNIAQKYDIPCYENPKKEGIAADWSFAASHIKTPYGAIMHQDDVYFPEYAERVVAGMKKSPETLIAFTDYCDLMSDGKFHKHRMYLYIKRMLLWAFYLKKVHRSRFWKRSALILGNAICCPAVSYNMEKLKELTFDTSYSVNLDWAKWLSLADTPGAFVFIPSVLMAHRIADSMETASAIADNRRYNEDKRIFESIWGKRIAGMLMYFYKKSYASNEN